MYPVSPCGPVYPVYPVGPIAPIAPQVRPEEPPAIRRRNPIHYSDDENERKYLKYKLKYLKLKEMLEKLKIN